MKSLSSDTSIPFTERCKTGNRESNEIHNIQYLDNEMNEIIARDHLAGYLQEDNQNTTHHSGKGLDWICHFYQCVLNVEYKFTYTSDGGMAQRSFTIPMNEENLTELISHLESKLSLEALAKEQRALMTAKLRTMIKERDNYTCCECGNSVHREPNLLLEIDHIKPISKGGLTQEDNLQTLCWKCNRKKGAKLI